MLRRGLIRAAAGLASLALLAGCGSDDDASSEVGRATRTATATEVATPIATETVDEAADKRIAEESVITLDDFPSGWTEADQSERSRVSCPSITSARRDASGVGNSMEFSRGRNTQAAGAVYVFADEAAATQAFEAMTSRETRLCYADRVTNAITGTAGLKVGEVKTARLSLDPLADQRAAGRVTVPVSSQGVDADVIIDLVFIRAERGLSLGLFIGVRTPFDEDLRADLTTKQVRRLSDALS